MTPRRRSLWPWGIIAGLTLAVSINLTMVWIALSHRSPMVPGDTEQDALAFDETIARRRAAVALGWRVTVSPCVRDEHDCVVLLDVVDRSGHAVSGLHGRAVARRADDARFDRASELHALAPGRYRGSFSPGATGVYALEIELAGGPAPWLGTRELWVPGTSAP
jgi:nitrogen fixation protein FixH